MVRINGLLYLGILSTIGFIWLASYIINNLSSMDWWMLLILIPFALFFGLISFFIVMGTIVEMKEKNKSKKDK